MGYGGHVCLRKMARGPAGSWCGLHAHGILRGRFSCGVGQLGYWQPLRVAGDVCGGGVPLLLAWIRHGVTEPVRWKRKEPVLRSWEFWRPFATLVSSAWRRRTTLSSALMLASISGLWAGNCVCSSSGDRAGGSRPRRTAVRAARFMCGDAGLFCDHPWLPDDVLVCPAFGSQGRAAVVFCVSLLLRSWRSEFCGVYIVAPGAVSDRVPGQRIRVFHVVCAIWRSGYHIFGRRERAALRLPGAYRWP
jgi:hypothetical protein